MLAHHLPLRASPPPPSSCQPTTSLLMPTTSSLPVPARHLPQCRQGMGLWLGWAEASAPSWQLPHPAVASGLQHASSTEAPGQGTAGRQKQLLTQAGSLTAHWALTSVPEGRAGLPPFCGGLLSGLTWVLEARSPGRKADAVEQGSSMSPLPEQTVKCPRGPCLPGVFSPLLLDRGDTPESDSPPPCPPGPAAIG